MLLETLQQKVHRLGIQIFLNFLRHIQSSLKLALTKGRMGLTPDLELFCWILTFPESKYRIFKSPCRSVLYNFQLLITLLHIAFISTIVTTLNMLVDVSSMLQTSTYCLVG